MIDWIADHARALALAVGLTFIVGTYAYAVGMKADLTARLLDADAQMQEVGPVVASR